MRELRVHRAVREDSRRARRQAVVAAVAFVAACHASDPPPREQAPQVPDDELAVTGEHSCDELAAYLQPLAGAELATRQREVASWQLDAAAWQRTVVAAYRDAYADYAAAFAAAAPAAVAQLAQPGEIRARRHFADASATLVQARLRWALPVLYPSCVATPFDTAFVFDGTHWRALLGLPDVQLSKTRAADPACAQLLATSGAPGPCSEVAWLVADAAMRGDRDALARACAIAAARCVVTRSP